MRQLGRAYAAHLAQFQHLLAILTRIDPAAAPTGPLSWPPDTGAVAGDCD